MEYTDIFIAQLDQYRDLSSSIKKYLIRYEMECLSIIALIKERNFEESQELFDQLHKIVELLSMAIYPYDYPVGEKISKLVHDFNRDDYASRKYWYEKLKNGLIWSG